MPTPFTHLACAQRLLDDEGLSAPQRALLQRHLSAFVLGSIAADAHSGAGLRREDTHFYSYAQPIDIAPAQVLLARYPTLAAPESAAQRVFIAGYIGHLALDEAWTESLMRPHFIEAAWGDSASRFLALNLLLIGLDERDRALLQPALGAALAAAEPQGWLPFLPDTALGIWQEVVARQLAPGAPSETLAIISQHTGRTVVELSALRAAPAELHARLWMHLPAGVLAATETRMNALALAQIHEYLG